MKTAYFDCFAGCGGDMIVAAMIDAGLDADFLQSRLDSLGIADLKIEVEKVRGVGRQESAHAAASDPGKALRFEVFETALLEGDCRERSCR